jgi:hypothetical protein
MSTSAPAINPCWHMRHLIHRLADGTLTGGLSRYVRYHVKYCKRCQQALDVIRAMLTRLQILNKQEPKLPDDRWTSIEAAWLEHEQTQPPD